AQLVQVAAPVVAQQAVDVGDSQKRVRYERGGLVKQILVGSACDVAVEDPVAGAVLIAVIRRGGDELVGHLVVRFAVGQGVMNPFVEGVAALRKALQRGA